MSIYTDVILTYGTYEPDDRIDVVNKIVRPEWTAGPFTLVDAQDASACRILIASINYFRADEFMAALRQIRWIGPEEVQLFYKPQDYIRFIVENLIDGTSAEK